MSDKDIKNTLQKAIDHRLSGLEGNPFLAQRIIASEKGDQPIVKKKITVSLILVIVLMALTLSAAYAWMQSNIASKLYGEETVPQEVVDHIELPNKSAEFDLGLLSIDELLYDGNSLYTSFTIANPTSETLLYTVDGIWLNGSPITRSTLIAEGAGTAGVLLGGSLGDTAMPTSFSIYNEGDALYQYDESGKYLGRTPLPEGDAVLKISVAVWRPINQPELVDYDDYEGINVMDAPNCLVTDSKGYADLELFRPEKYNLNTSAAKRSSEIYAEAYKALGWAEFVDRIDMEMEVNLNPNQLSHVSPKQTEYQLDDLKLTITSFSLTHTGGRMDGWIYGDDTAVEAFMGEGLYLADKAGNRVLNISCIYEDKTEDAEGVHFCLEFYPVAGELPEAVYLAPFVAHDPRWDEHSISYNPDVEEPENVIGAFQLDLSRAIYIELE